MKYANFAEFLQESCKKYSLCTNLAKIAILLQTCKILVRNAKLARISEEFCKICDSCNLGNTAITVHRQAILLFSWNPGHEK